MFPFSFIMFKWSKSEADYLANIIISFIFTFMFIGQGIYVFKNFRINWTYIGNVVVTLTEDKLVLPVCTKVSPLRWSHCARLRRSLCLVWNRSVSLELSMRVKTEIDSDDKGWVFITNILNYGFHVNGKSLNKA